MPTFMTRAKKIDAQWAYRRSWVQPILGKADREWEHYSTHARGAVQDHEYERVERRELAQIKQEEERQRAIAERRQLQREAARARRKTPEAILRRAPLRRASDKRWYETHKEQALAAMRAYRLADLDKARAGQRAASKKFYYANRESEVARCWGRQVRKTMGKTANNRAKIMARRAALGLGNSGAPALPAGRKRATLPTGLS